jgi:hypothetical protein
VDEIPVDVPEGPAAEARRAAEAVVEYELLALQVDGAGAREVFGEVAGGLPLEDLLDGEALHDVDLDPGHIRLTYSDT